MSKVAIGSRKDISLQDARALISIQHRLNCCSRLRMKINLKGLLHGVRDLITSSDGTSPNAYGYCLEQLHEHLETVSKDPARWPEFAELYCLPKPEEKP
jgi:hypothetical protein